MQFKSKVADWLITVVDVVTSLAFNHQRRDNFTDGWAKAIQTDKKRFKPNLNRTNTMITQFLLIFFDNFPVCQGKLIKKLRIMIT